MPSSWGADRIGVFLGSHRPTIILKLSCLVEKKRRKVCSLAVLFSVANWDLDQEEKHRLGVPC
ncbi:hypothetical protein ACOSP7_014133 [Xanthoceras sorbifolium]